MINAFYYTDNPRRTTQSFATWEDACRLLAFYEVLIDHEDVLEYTPIRREEAQRQIRRRELVRRVEDKQRDLYLDNIPEFYQAEEVETLLLNRRDSELWAGRVWEIECPLIVIDDMYVKHGRPSGNIIHVSYRDEEAFVRSLETLGVITLVEVPEEEAFPIEPIDDESCFLPDGYTEG